MLKILYELFKLRFKTTFYKCKKKKKEYRYENITFLVPRYQVTIASYDHITLVTQEEEIPSMMLARGFLQRGFTIFPFYRIIFEVPIPNVFRRFQILKGSLLLANEYV